MTLTDTEIHRAELLLTLNYLIKCTDEDHPAKILAICLSANDFRLKYDKKLEGKKGNDVKRQRISNCLAYLFTISRRYPDFFPFIIRKNDSGKYYVEKRYDLFDEQILKILAAVNNDKYTSPEDAAFLTERLIDIFSNVHNRENIKNDLKLLTRNISKYSSRKLKIVTKALNEKKLLLLRQALCKNNSETKDIKIEEIDRWYRVSSIKEINNKAFAVLVSVDDEGLICESIEDLPIPEIKGVLSEEFEINRDLDKALKQNINKMNS